MGACCHGSLFRVTVALSASTATAPSNFFRSKSNTSSVELITKTNSRCFADAKGSRLCKNSHQESISTYGVNANCLHYLANEDVSCSSPPPPHSTICWVWVEGEWRSFHF